MAEPETPITVRALAQSVAVVTGGTSGIGLESAAQLAEAGVTQIVVNGRDGDRGTAAVDAIKARVPGTDARFAAADVNAPEGADSVMANAIEAPAGKTKVTSGRRSDRFLA